MPGAWPGGSTRPTGWAMWTSPSGRAVIDPFVAEYCRGPHAQPLPRLQRRWCGFPNWCVWPTARAAPSRPPVTTPASTGGRSGPACCAGLDPGQGPVLFPAPHRPDLFARLVFPLGWYDKAEVREAARELGIERGRQAGQPGDLFRSRRGPELPVRTGRRRPRALAPGDIVDRQGEVLGRHRGLIHYTVGQRKGLGVAAAGSAVCPGTRSGRQAAGGGIRDGTARPAPWPRRFRGGGCRFPRPLERGRGLPVPDGEPVSADPPPARRGPGGRLVR